jgi:hypothetical protein
MLCFRLQNALWLKKHMFPIAFVKKIQFSKFQINFKLKRGNMRKSCLGQNMEGTLDCHCMKGFFGRLRKAKVMSKKLKNE